MRTLENTSSLTRVPDLIATDMDGELVMMSIEHGAYFGVGGVGTRVWELLEKPVLFTEIVNIICAEYEVDEAVCQSDMKLFIEQMMKNGLVTQIEAG